MSESIRQLRLLRDTGPQQEMIVISGADPLNLVGVLDDQPRVPSIASHKLVYLDGRSAGTSIAEQVWLSPCLTEAQQTLVRQLLERGKAGDVAVDVTPRKGQPVEHGKHEVKSLGERAAGKLPRAGLERSRRVL